MTNGSDRQTHDVGPKSLGQRLRTAARQTAPYLGVTTVTLVVLDVLLIVLGLFPPAGDPGNPEVGWLPASGTGKIRETQCIEYSTGEVFSFFRNEAGLRSEYSVSDLASSPETTVIAVTGDSHTDLCAPNRQTHFGVLEDALVAEGIAARSYAFGAGMYSPLQAYMAVRPSMVEYDSDVLVLNFYTGNDFYDLLRVDDRPHLVAGANGYTVAPPIWYRHDPPDSQRRSRVLFALREVSDRVGLRQVFLRLRYLRAAAAEQDVGLWHVFGYMNDLRKAMAPELGYPAAYSAQMLNQQLFFHHFPDAKAESLRRAEALLGLIRKEHPDRTLVLSPLPSYQLVRAGGIDAPLESVWQRLPIDHESALQEEGELYEELRDLAARTGWLFVDNLAALRPAAPSNRLFNAFDYHLLPPASALVGQTQAEVIAAELPGRN